MTAAALMAAPLLAEIQRSNDNMDKTKRDALVKKLDALRGP
jgi:hypothetical protein